MKKILIIGDFPAPYRVEVFRDLSKKYDTTVFFEFQQDNDRNMEWINSIDFSYEILNNRKSRQYYINELKHIKKYDCVIVYNNSLKYSLITELMCISKKVPCFINCDGCFSIEESNPLKKALKKYLTKHATACFAGSRSAEEYYSYYGAEKENIYSHNFTSLHKEDIEIKTVSLEDKIRIKKELGIVEEKVIITVGRYIKVKGFDILLEAAKKMDKNVGIYIIGGKPTDEFISYKEKYNLLNVHYIDFKNKDELKKYYRASDIFVLMTRGDTWGLVINEAMANGLPIITTEKCVAGVELVKDGENGYIIPVDDSGKLKQKINILLEDNKLVYDMGKNNINKIRDNIIDNIAESHIKVIEKVIIQNKLQI